MYLEHTVLGRLIKALVIVTRGKMIVHGATNAKINVIAGNTYFHQVSLTVPLCKIHNVCRVSLCA